MKNFILILISFFVLLRLRADTAISVFTTNETRLVLTNALIVQSLQMSATSAGAFVLQLLDNNVPSSVFTNAAITNFVARTTNVVTTLVGAAGVTNIFTNTVIVFDTTIIAANTNVSILPLAYLAVNANESLFIPGPFICSKGLVVKNLSAEGTNVLGGSIIVNYRRP